MFSKISTTNKMHGLVAVASLIASFVRHSIQYGEYCWPSVGQFLISWLIHYFAVLIVIGGFYVLSQTTHEFFFGKGYDDSNKLSVEEASIYGALLIILLSVFAFVVMHWPVSEGRFQ